MSKISSWLALDILSAGTFRVPQQPSTTTLELRPKWILT